MSAPDLVGELERWLVELARKWERFFAGDRQVSIPPERERVALARRLQELSRTEPPTAGEKFRMEQLLHRFATHNQLWQRQLREREEARQEYREVFARYLEALGSAGREAAVGFEGFRDALEQQRRQIESRGAHVEGFEVVADGGNVRVRARVRRGRQA
ncbi:MAG: hypothetical protein B7Z61_03450 [Acidobacteria bacterium 37-71-11]|nr:MAG: hypothetical protein B7Z61_03450 [Acidobacteria bacterium 37-71-11]